MADSSKPEETQAGGQGQMTNLYIGPTIIFRDTSDGGWYCQECKRYLHPDLVPSHKCGGLL